MQVGLATLQGEFNTDFGMLMTGAAGAAIPTGTISSEPQADSSHNLRRPTDDFRVQELHSVITRRPGP